MTDDAAGTPEGAPTDDAGSDDEDPPSEEGVVPSTEGDADGSEPTPTDETDSTTPDEPTPTATDEPTPTPTDESDPTATDDTDPTPTDESAPAQPGVPDPDDVADSDVPEDVRKYDRFTKMDGAQYERVNEFLRDRTYVTAREWAIARLCSDFRTETGVEMTKIGENLPELVPFMTDTYTPQAVNQARSSFDEKVRKAGATFLYGAMCDFYTAEELDEVMYEVTEVAKFLLEVEGVDLSVDEELDAEDRISAVMRDVRSSSEALRHDGTECPECGHTIGDD